jgi:hypothetical protein
LKATSTNPTLNRQLAGMLWAGTAVGVAATAAFGLAIGMLLGLVAAIGMGIQARRAEFARLSLWQDFGNKKNKPRRLPPQALVCGIAFLAMPWLLGPEIATHCFFGHYAARGLLPLLLNVSPTVLYPSLAMVTTAALALTLSRAAFRWRYVWLIRCTAVLHCFAVTP